MSVAGRDAQILGRVLLLGLGDVGATILAVVDPTGSLPFRFLREVGDGLDGVPDGQEVHETDVLLLDQLDDVDGSELA